jgi:hypothetical protein
MEAEFSREITIWSKKVAFPSQQTMLMGEREKLRRFGFNHRTEAETEGWIAEKVPSLCCQICSATAGKVGFPSRPMSTNTDRRASKFSLFAVGGGLDDLDELRLQGCAPGEEIVDVGLRRELVPTNVRFEWSRR